MNLVLQKSVGIKPEGVASTLCIHEITCENIFFLTNNNTESAVLHRMLKPPTTLDNLDDNLSASSQAIKSANVLRNWLDRHTYFHLPL
jgi:hypothetical protein